MAKENPALVYKQMPSGEPVAGQDIAIEDVDSVPAEAPENGVLAQVYYASLDPYLRGLLRDPKIKSYFPAFEIGKPMKVMSIAKVLKSSASGFKEGDVLLTMTPVQRYVTLSGEALTSARKLEDKIEDQSLDIRNYLGSLGMPGLTAYGSFYEIGKPKKGETIFISSAAGAVGQVVGQLAKREGLTVIGSVGSDEKLSYLVDELKFDSGFNYKKEKPSDALERLAPNGIDIYFENVGAEHLEAAINSLNKFGRIIACGMIAEYNAKSPEDRFPHRNLMSIVGKQLTLRGFLVNEDPSIGPKHGKEHVENVRKWLQDGSFISKIHEWDINEGDQGFVGMLRGENFGKAVLKVS